MRLSKEMAKALERVDVDEAVKALEDVLGIHLSGYVHVPGWLKNGRLSDLALTRQSQEKYGTVPEDRLSSVEGKFYALLKHLRLEWVEGGQIVEIKKGK